MADNKNDYEVGYGKPPQKSQFKKGQSGNQKGRPKGARGLKTDLKAELSERVAITENGKTRNLTKQQLVVKRLTTSAAKGDIRAISKLIDLISTTFGVEDEPTQGGASLSTSDDAILRAYFQRRGAEFDDEVEDENNDT